jgi:hypothetical protein
MYDWFRPNTFYHLLCDTCYESLSDSHLVQDRYLRHLLLLSLAQSHLIASANLVIFSGNLMKIREYLEIFWAKFTCFNCQTNYLCRSVCFCFELFALIITYWDSYYCAFFNDIFLYLEVYLSLNLRELSWYFFFVCKMQIWQYQIDFRNN